MTFETVRHHADDHDDDDDGTVAVAPKAKKTARELLANALLGKVVGRRGRRLLSKSIGPVAIVVVPAAAYAEPVKQALRGLNAAAWVQTITEKKKSTIYAVDHELESYMDKGRPLVVITQDLGLVPSVVLAGADLHLRVYPPDAKIVRQVIKRITGGRGRDLTDADTQQKTFGEIAAAIRSGSTAAECVARLKRTPARPSGGEGEENKALGLDVLPVFGEAKLWTVEVLVDIERMRRGEIGPSDVESVLLYGPPGTGKTLLASALAKTANLPFFATSVASWFTQSDGHLDGVLKQAEAFFQTLLGNAPCVGLLDELEALPDRATLDSRHREWWNSVVTGVMLMVSRLREAGKGVVLIGATNYLDRVDGALKRPGRIGRHILVRPPETEEEVAELIKFYAGNDLGEADVAYAAKLAGNTTPAAVEAWMKAARRAAREAERVEVIDDLISQIAPPDTRSERELFSCALHEAAHAVAALELGFELKSVSVIVEGNAGGQTLSRGKANMPTLADVENRVVMTLAGRAADQLLSGDADVGSMSDLEIATRVLVAARVSHGLRDSLVYRADEASFETLLRIDPLLLRQVDDDLTRLMQRTVALVQRRRGDIIALAEALVKRRFVSGTEAAAIVGHRASAGAAAGAVAHTDGTEEPAGSAAKPSRSDAPEKSAGSGDPASGDGDREAVEPAPALRAME